MQLLWVKVMRNAFSKAAQLLANSRAQALESNPRALSLEVRLSKPLAAGGTVQPSEAAAIAPATLQTAGFLVAIGDSWFDYPIHDVLKDLSDNYGYNVESTAHAGDPIEAMAYHQSQLDDFPRQLEKVTALGAVPHAALLSGGGDDIAGPEFGMLLNNAFSPIAGWDAEVVEGVLNERILTAFINIISSVDSLIKSYFNRSIPIFLHGYDYPVPDGRGFLGGFGHYLLGPWLEPGFREKNFMDVTQRVQMMQTILDKFNTMLASLPAQFPFVHYLDLRGTLSIDLTNNAYEDWWANELHPTVDGFAKVTDKFASALQALP
jgi:hypothetical protein